MRLDIAVNIDTRRALMDLGLGSDHRAQKFLASEVERFSRPYVPKSTGAGAHMATSAEVASDGSTVTYQGPYAHYQYYGEVMEGTAPKTYTGRDIQYTGGGLRGKEWDKRMLADKADEIVGNLEIHMRGRRG